MALAIVFSAHAASQGDEQIHIDEAPAYACIGEGCPSGP